MIKTAANSQMAQRHITQRLIPNSCTRVAKHQSGIFCGLFSADGEVYMSACKGKKIKFNLTSSTRRKNKIVQHAQLEKNENHQRQRRWVVSHQLRL
jgi:hypothetical protein